MKTPRQLLFERHRAAEPKLDAIRQEAVTSLAKSLEVSSKTRPSASRSRHSLSWRDLLLSFRWHLAGLSAGWLLICGFNFAAADHSETVAQRPPSRETLLAWRENERLLAELLGAIQSQPPDPAEPRNTAAPQPRSERKRERVAV